MLSLFFGLQAVSSPLRTTYQARIVKPDGHPLENSSVNFRFTILDPSASCVLYVEDFTAINMVDSGGLISFSLGSGVRSFPTSGTAQTFANTFNNGTTSFSCQTPGIYTPAAHDNRKVVMQFHDGSGWQTLPAMIINAVPYAMYAWKADDSTTLNGKADTAFVQYSSIPTCTASQALQYNGASFQCVTAGGGSGGSSYTVTASDVSNALGYTPVNPVSVTTVTSTVNSLGTSVSTMTTQLNSLSASMAAITSSQWITSGSTIIYNQGNVGIGVSNPTGVLHTFGSTPIYHDRVGSNGAHLALRSANGSAASMTNRLAGEDLGQVSFGAYDGSTYRSNDTGIVAVAAENWTGSSNTGSNLYFKTKGIGAAGNATARLTILSSGTVGIGTTAPAYTLDVSGTINMGNNALLYSGGRPLLVMGTSGNTYMNSSGTATGIRFQPNGTAIMIAKENGVGIGTMNPSAILHLGAGTSVSAALKLTSGTLLSSPQSGTIEFDGVNLYYTDGNNVRQTLSTLAGSGITSSSVITALGYTPADNAAYTTTATSATIHTLAINNLTTSFNNLANSATTLTTQVNGLTASMAAMTPSQWITSATNISYSLGNVGIGTVNPAKTLQLEANAPSMRFRNQSANYNWDFVTNSNSNQYLSLQNNSGITVAQFQPNFVNMYTSMGVGSNGSATSPNSRDYFLAVGSGSNGQFPGVVLTPASNYNTNGSWEMLLSATGASSNNFQINNGTNPRLVIDSTGKVGLGTSNTTYPLTVSGTIAALSGGFRFPDGTLQTTAVVSSAASIAQQLGYTPANAAAASQWTTSGTGIYYASGNVGVGITNPRARLNVVGSGAPGIMLADWAGGTWMNQHQSITQAPSSFTDSLLEMPYTLIGGNSFLDRSEVLIGGSTNMASDSSVQNIIFYTHPTKNTALGNERMRIDRNGNVGIGTNNPGYPLEVSGTIASTNGGFRFPDGTLQTTAATAASSTQWTTVGSDIKYSTGNVGIGTSNPTRALYIGKNQNAATGMTIDNVANGNAARSIISLNSEAAGFELFSTSTNFAGSYGGLPVSDSVVIRSYSTASIRPQAMFIGTGGADSVHIMTADTPRLMVEGSTGNVGIGTTNPLFPLQVSGTMHADKMRVGFSSGTNFLMDYNNTSSLSNSGTWGFVLRENWSGTDKIFINRESDGGDIILNGKVGVGTKTPAYPLTVSGTIASLSGGYRFPDGTIQTTAANAASATQWTTSGTGIYYNTGNVGIGTNSPAAALDIFTGNLRFSTMTSGNGITGYSGGGVNVMNLVREDALGSGGVTMSAYAGIGFSTGVTTASTNYNMYITSAGAVGIGTTAPAYKLTVSGTIASLSGGYRFPDGTTQTTAAVSSANAVAQMLGYVPVASGSVQASQWSSSGTMIYYNSGNVGIGTNNPATKLDVLGDLNVGVQTSPVSTTIKMGGPWTGYGLRTWSLKTEDGKFSIKHDLEAFQTEQTPMTILANNNIGIGTTTPARKLSVSNTNSTAYISSGTSLSGAIGLLLENPSTTNSTTFMDMSVNGGNGVGHAYIGATYSGWAVANPPPNLVFGTNKSNYSEQMTLAGVFGTLAIGYPASTLGGSTPNSSLLVSGSVGIGTNLPSSKLTVAGQIESTTGGFRFPDSTSQTTAVYRPVIFTANNTVTVSAGSAASGTLSTHSWTAPITGNVLVTYTKIAPYVFACAGGNMWFQVRFNGAQGSWSSYTMVSGINRFQNGEVAFTPEIDSFAVTAGTTYTITTEWYIQSFSSCTVNTRGNSGGRDVIRIEYQ